MAFAARALGFPDLGPGSALRAWTNALGSPATVPQRDEGTTFFYWPQHGIAVFCHPHFMGQYRQRMPSDWVVTSVFIPVRLSVKPTLPPTDDARLIVFSKLLIDDAQIAGLDHTGPIRKYYDESGALLAVEIRKRDGLFGDYD
jgi:hypothetical protein